MPVWTPNDEVGLESRSAEKWWRQCKFDGIYKDYATIQPRGRMTPWQVRRGATAASARSSNALLV